MRIGLISDTHGLLRPEATQALQGVDHIIHAGDIGNSSILEQLADIAPLIAVRGNNDFGAWADALPTEKTLELGGATLYVLHDVNELDLDLQAAGIQVVISGHSHSPLISTQNGVLFVNPGSTGPRRFKLPVSLAFLEITHGKAAAELRIFDL
ncbi:MAG: YfcE family phosphodiesterase [Burkholderiales bacterium RIFCSPLOWO2_02_FULL_57_36]|nr:MAG: YfcE family phosphodiesterase [Burkholderiales bacterium RIFCSPLOWO2_02_FULL_57_36]